jgi:2-keto-4-pentenoate hydratase
MISRTPGETLLGITERQWRDYQPRTPGTYFAEQHDSLTLDEAYAIQTAVSLLRTGAGDSIRGYKVGCTGVGTIEQFGMQGPIRGYLYRSELRRSGDELDSARLRKSGDRS